MTKLVAGVVFLSSGGDVLLLKRSNYVDHAGEWSLPGGRVEANETPEAGAQRECQEEIGVKPPRLKPFTRRISDGVDYRAFLVVVPKKFKPKLNNEHTDFMWVDPLEAPEDIHPGLKIVLDRLGMDELDVAKKIASGDLPSPQQYENVWLFAMRITGTGQSYRKQMDEYVWRDPAIYLTKHFLERCNGLQVILEHPEGQLNTNEFRERTIGTILLPYIKGTSVWGIAKIYDADAAQVMREHQLSTSPAVSFRDGSVNEKSRSKDGSSTLIEGDPNLLDHLAVCPLGVWDKGTTPSGIDISGEITMAEETNDDRMKKDAARAERLDKILDRMDAMNARMDAWEKKTRADEGDDEEAKKRAEALKKADRKDGEEAPKAPEGEEGEGTPAETAADESEDGKKKREEEEARRREDARHAADARRRADEVDDKRRMDAEETKRRMDAMEERLPREETEEEREEMADAVSRADAAFGALGEKTMRPAPHEAPISFRRRIINRLKKHSSRYGEVNLATVTDPNLFSVVERDVYADAMTAAHNPVGLPAGTLREIKERDSTGRIITKFVGSPDACWGPFKAVTRRLTGINKEV